MKTIIRFSDNTGCVEFDNAFHKTDKVVTELSEYVNIKSIETK